MTKKTLTLNLPDKEMATLTETAKEHSETKTTIIRQALKMYIDYLNYKDGKKK